MNGIRFGRFRNQPPSVDTLLQTVQWIGIELRQRRPGDVGSKPSVFQHDGHSVGGVQPCRIEDPAQAFAQAFLRFSLFAHVTVSIIALAVSTAHWALEQTASAPT